MTNTSFRNILLYIAISLIVAEPQVCIANQCLEEVAQNTPQARALSYYTSYNAAKLHGSRYFIAPNPLGSAPGDHIALWKWDGKVDSEPVVVSDFPGSNSASRLYSAQPVNVHGALYISTSQEIWISNGTSEGTVLLKTFRPMYEEIKFHYFKGEVYFNLILDGKHFLYKTNGTPTGTVFVKKIKPSDLKFSAINYNDSLYFLGLRQRVDGVRLWLTNGTRQGTVKVNQVEGINIQSLINYKNIILLAGRPGGLWRTDGTVEGTVQLSDQWPELQGQGFGAINTYAFLNNILYLTMQSNNTYTGDLWKTDGTPEGTQMVKEFANNVNSFDIDFLTKLNGELFFVTNAVNSGAPYNKALWKTDGTTMGTTLVKDVLVNKSRARLESFVKIHNKLFFTTRRGVPGGFMPNPPDFTALWRSNGTVPGTIQLEADPSFSKLIKYNGSLYIYSHSGQFKKIRKSCI